MSSRISCRRPLAVPSPPLYSTAMSLTPECPVASSTFPLKIPIGRSSRSPWSHRRSCAGARWNLAGASPSSRSHGRRPRGCHAGAMCPASWTLARRHPESPADVSATSAATLAATSPVTSAATSSPCLVASLSDRWVSPVSVSPVLFCFLFSFL